MAETVYVLGAGFAAPLGGPLIGDFLSPDSRDYSTKVGELWASDEIRTLLDLLDSLPDEDQNIEGMMNLVTSASFFGGTFGRYSPKTLGEFLLEYVATFVRERVGVARNDKRYRFFAKNHFADRDVSIITFNYDISADQLLFDAFEGIDYGFPAWSKYRYYKLRRARTGPLLLKLHGSLNWMVCGSCKNVWLHDEYSNHLSGRRCLRDPDCQGIRRTLIVPPLWSKELAAKDMEIQWSLALQELLHAKRVITIGYSFPRQDRLAVDLFRYSFSRNRRARFEVHNGSSFDYERLQVRLKKKINKQGSRMQDFLP